MPSVKLSVRLAFANGEEPILTSVETPAVFAAPAVDGDAPYVFADATVPEEPIMVSSSSFIRVG